MEEEKERPAAAALEKVNAAAADLLVPAAITPGSDARGELGHSQAAAAAGSESRTTSARASSRSSLDWSAEAIR